MKKRLWLAIYAASSMSLSGCWFWSGVPSKQGDRGLTHAKQVEQEKNIPVILPENATEAQIKAFAYLEFLTVANEFFAYYLAHCNQGPCDNRSLRLKVQALLKAHPAAFYMGELMSGTAFLDLRQGFDTEQWEALSVAMGHFATIMAEIRTESVDAQLLEIDLNDFAKAQSQDLLNSVKANMHTLQTILETYAVDWGGVYPDDVYSLKYEATQAAHPYWEVITNPYTGQKDFDGALMDSMHYRGELSQGGQVIYRVTSPGYKAYVIYGSDAHGQLLQEGSASFYLSNS